MTEISEQATLLLGKLENLRHRQDVFQKEIDDLRDQIRNLSALEQGSVEIKVPEPIRATMAVPDPEPMRKAEVFTEPEQDVQEQTGLRAKTVKKSDLEKFIGANLINKIGIAITVLGVGIGAKYAIDHELISPLTRIILGYLVGVGLLGFALKLKRQYLSFSAVLLSGSMAIFYFVTFAAFNFYFLISLVPAFILMVFITVVSVGASILYNRQVIAHIGLVGAYAVPFLLDTGSGRIEVLFGYMTIINAGILIVSLNRYWKSLLFSSFILTWLIFFSWYISKYDPALHFTTGFVFSSVFFLVFYLILMGYKLLKKELFEIEDILLLLANSGIFYGMGYSMLYRNETGVDLLGTFTLANAFVHFIFWGFLYLKKQTDKTLVYFIGMLAIVFLTIAIPVQFDGKWVTLLWATEAALLFYLGRAKNISVYEWLSYPLIFLMAFSLILDWLLVVDTYHTGRMPGIFVPVFNIGFFTSLFVVSSLGLITRISRNQRFPSSLTGRHTFINAMNIAIPALFLIVLYFSFFVEIQNYWAHLYESSMKNLNNSDDPSGKVWNTDLDNYRTIAVLIYSQLFFAGLSIFNNRKIHDRLLAVANLTLSVVFLAVSLTFGLIALGELRESYLNPLLSGYFYRGSFHIIIRYLAFLFNGLICYAIFDTIKSKLIPLDFKMEFDFLLHITILTIAGNELINWMDLAHAQNSHKLGLSILFGSYSLVLIILGILQKKKHLRLGAMLLFSATLIKLFLYDLVSLDTISKTIIFLALGVLLLIISFLYNKYAVRIFDEHHEEG